VMDHVSKQGEPKILPHCTLPLTGAGVVDLIISDLCVFSCDKKHGGLTLLELAPGTALEVVIHRTGAPFATAFLEV
jgi:3-oxoacid CoA-transferase subunit B